MPALFSLRLKQALNRVQQQLRDNEFLFAYLDDVYVMCDPSKARVVFDMIRHALLQDDCRSVLIALLYGRRRRTGSPDRARGGPPGNNLIPGIWQPPAPVSELAPPELKS